MVAQKFYISPYFPSPHIFYTFYMGLFISSYFSIHSIWDILGGKDFSRVPYFSSPHTFHHLIFFFTFYTGQLGGG